MRVLKSETKLVGFFFILPFYILSQILSHDEEFVDQKFKYFVIL